MSENPEDVEYIYNYMMFVEVISYIHFLCVNLYDSRTAFEYWYTLECNFLN